MCNSVKDEKSNNDEAEEYLKFRWVYLGFQLSIYVIKQNYVNIYEIIIIQEKVLGPCTTNQSNMGEYIFI